MNISLSTNKQTGGVGEERLLAASELGCACVYRLDQSVALGRIKSKLEAETLRGSRSLVEIEIAATHGGSRDRDFSYA